MSQKIDYHKYPGMGLDEIADQNNRLVCLYVFPEGYLLDRIYTTPGVPFPDHLEHVCDPQPESAENQPFLYRMIQSFLSLADYVFEYYSDCLFPPVSPAPTKQENHTITQLIERYSIETKIDAESLIAVLFTNGIYYIHKGVIYSEKEGESSLGKFSSGPDGWCLRSYNYSLSKRTQQLSDSNE